MKAWKVVLSTLVVAAVAIGAALAGVVYTGVYNVAASDKHWPITYWTLKQTVKHSVSRHAESIDAPPLGGEKQLLTGAANFDAMCTGCHMPPGGQKSAAAKGMYPAPANLSESGEEMPARQIFWVIKHGIKASGMPAWGETHGADEMWAMTALIKQFPAMSGADYQRLVQTAKARSVGHRHGGGEDNEHTEGEAHGAGDEAGGHDDADTSHEDDGRHSHG